ncbi:carbonic anhydrase 9-like protein [Leptotrombidium deliense]|uniref:carbonic anhydrase n=1 Tax=Leptotrombidium deliense TaxID=299467 RepID=A0A443SC57_9ACAR|nr:carbonic anhydrase 9-like protein [Leptotrombidium deliense]
MLYHSLSQAIEHADGLVVISAFFEVSETRNVPFDPLFRALPKIEKYASNTTLDEDIDAMSLLPKNLNSFYMYTGSLTTPPCSEAVTFIIYKEKLTLSRDQLNELRKLQYVEKGVSKPILMNSRNLQEVNKRTIFATEKSKASVSKATNGMLALFVLLIAITSRNKLSDQLVQ